MGLLEYSELSYAQSSIPLAQTEAQYSNANRGYKKTQINYKPTSMALPVKKVMWRFLLPEILIGNQM